MQSTLWIFFVCLLTQVSSHQGCIHDELVRNHKLIPIDDRGTGRNLQGSQYGPMRFHVIYNTTDVNESTTVGKTVMKMMNIITLFWSKTLEVCYAPSLSFNANFGKQQPVCLYYTISQEIINNPVLNADFGFLVDAKNDGNTGVIASSIPCAYSLTTKAPIWGAIHWNINYIKQDLQSFQHSLMTGLHETTHLLGFSSLLYEFYQKGKMISNSKGSFINGTFIQAALKDQYGCSTATGMLLESRGGSATAGSHWSYKAAFNEYMTYGVMIHKSTISYITLALLQETGWYKTVHKTYGKFLTWGYQKGCGMLQDTNCDSEEYCTEEGVKSCDHDLTALGYCKNQTFSACKLVKYYTNTICTDPNFDTKNLNSNISGITGEAGGYSGRCFDSTLVVQGAEKTRFPFRCYKVECSSSGLTLTVQVGQKYAICLFPEQNITIKGYSGYLICPKSFSKICGSNSVKNCPNECSGNGYCLQGKCLCFSNYTGDSCNQLPSVDSPTPKPVRTQQSNKYCEMGSYRTVSGDCEPCSVNCFICDNQGCLLCFGGNLPRSDRTCQ